MARPWPVFPVSHLNLTSLAPLVEAPPKEAKLKTSLALVTCWHPKPSLARQAPVVVLASQGGPGRDVEAFAPPHFSRDAGGGHDALTGKAGAGLWSSREGWSDTPASTEGTWNISALGCSTW